jgi:nitrogen regulatory protein PII
MTAFSLLVCIVPHDSGEFVTQTATAAGAAGGTVLMGRNIASNGLLQALAIGDTSKDIVYILVSSEEKKLVIRAVMTASEKKRKFYGILFTISAAYFIRTGIVTGGDNDMAQTMTHQMITVIANKGYADDIMAAARKAGAGGGTVINARGTARPGDAKFFGMEIVPEKEMVIILVDAEKTQGVLNAVKTLSCLEKPGSGIAFCCPAGDFTVLGGRKPEEKK